MGYYKNTIYTGPNAIDAADHDPEAVAERRTARKRDYSWLANWDAPTCALCQAPAPEGQVWADGICTDCRV